MLEAVADKLCPGGRALDVGCGSGYVTACMALMVGPEGRVIGIDHVEDLKWFAIKNIRKDHPQLLSDGTVKIEIGRASCRERV